MFSKQYLALLIIFGVVLTYFHCDAFTLRDEDDDDSAADVTEESDSDEDLSDEKRAIESFLEDQQDANQYLDQARRLFSDQKSHMKEAKKKYEEKCERLLHPRYCPDLNTWPVWNQAFSQASGKK